MPFTDSFFQQAPQERPTTGLAIPPELLAQFAERRRAATRGVQQAEIEGERERSQAQRQFDQFLAQLRQETDLARSEVRGEAAARNMAFQPQFVGRGERDIRDRTTEAAGQASTQKADTMSAIDRQIQAARDAREREIAAIDRDRTRVRADADNLIRPPGR